MSMTDGIEALIDFATPATVAAKIAALKSAIPDPDTTSTSGAIQGIVGFLDQMSPMAAAQLRVELDALADDLAGSGGSAAYGQYTVTAGDATANLVNITTGLADLTLADCAVTVFRAGSNVTSDAVISEPSAGTLRIADGSTYNTTAGDIINWLARA